MSPGLAVQSLLDARLDLIIALSSVPIDNSQVSPNLACDPIREFSSESNLQNLSEV